MAKGVRAQVRHITHAFPGEHYLLVRPMRDDARRSVIDAPRRGRRVRARHRRQDKKKLNKVLLKDTHKGRAAIKGPKNPNKAPTTMKPRSAYSAKTQVLSAHHRGSKGRIRSDAGVKAHRPRLLSPHHPYAYHVLPVRRAGQMFKKFY